MNVLAFDTSGSRLGVAVESARGRSVVLREAGLKHGEMLAPQIESELAASGLSAADLDLVVCARGPGSFTGLRIGMATAKGLSAGLGIPVVSIPVPDFLCRPFVNTGLPVLSVQDARKGRFYGALFYGGERLLDYFDSDLPGILAQLDRLLSSGQQVLLTGPDTELFLQRLPDTPGRSLLSIPADRGAVLDLLDLGRERLASTGADAPGQGPLYLRPSEAELSLKEKR